MKTKTLITLLLVGTAFVVLFQNCSKGFEALPAAFPGGASLNQTFSTLNATSSSDLQTRFWFFPNQLGAQEYWKPKGNLVNGHWAESFSNFSYWPQLSQKLAQIGGGVGIIATEIAFMTKAQIDDIRARGLRIQIDELAWTQCMDGYRAARWEMYGESQNNWTLKRLVYGDKPAPFAGIYDQGFFKTRDGHDFVPDEIVLDERMGLILPPLDANLLANPNGTWEERKARARAAPDRCPQADTFNPGVPRLQGILSDYVEYSRVMREKWPTNTPKLSFHWNATPGWEMGWDEKCIDAQRAAALARGEPDPYLDPTTLPGLKRPCYHEDDLRNLIVGLCMDGQCPSTVYFDMDLTYSQPWTLEFLRRQKALLSGVQLPDGRVVSVGYGLNIHDHCYVAGTRCVRGFQNGMLTDELRDGNQNQMYAESTLNVARFLRHHGVMDENTVIKFFTWDARPFEVGEQVRETNAHSMAHTALILLGESPPKPAPPLAPPAPALPPVRYGAVSAGFDMSCDHFNPDAIKSLSTETILWLASIQSSGLTLHENYVVARQAGYNGAFGGGEHIAYQNANPEHRIRFEAMRESMANQPNPPYATFRDHHVGQRAKGYRGLWLCGGGACYFNGQCDDLGRRL